MENSPPAVQKSPIGWKTRVFCYSALFCAGFASALLLLNRTYALINTNDATYLLPEECYIGAYFQFPLTPPTTKLNQNERFFDQIDIQIEVAEKNILFKRHQQLRKTSFKFEPLIAALIIYILTTAFTIVLFLLHCFNIKCLPLTFFCSGFSLSLYIIACFSFIKYFDPDYCEKAFWSVQA